MIVSMAPMTGIDPLRVLADELDAWRRAGLTATLWWRDDDAGEVSANLDRLISMASRHRVVCGVATVPAWTTEALAHRVHVNGAIEILQHGYAHINHAPRGRGLGAWELGLHRPERVVIQELCRGREILHEMAGPRFLPVVAAPWNHIDPALYPAMVAAGFIGVSAAGPRAKAHPIPGLRQVNGHCDPIKWKGGARFKGVDKSIRDMVEHLAARRTGEVDATEPTGLLTHHRDTDEPCWRFLNDLVGVTRLHPAVRWLAPSEIWT